MRTPGSTQFTPGPWYVVGDPWGDGTFVNAGTPDPHGGKIVADCALDDNYVEHGLTGDEVAANARLIAAAPDLLTALELFLDAEDCRFDHEGYCQTHGVTKPCRMRRAWAAYAAATTKA